MIDSHAHINDPAFDEDRAIVIQKSFAAGLTHLVEIACEPPEWAPAIELCTKYPGKIYAVAGMHPIYAKDFTQQDLAILNATLSAATVRAVGEIGLDYAYEGTSPRKNQQNVFEQMLELAPKFNKPIVLHCRKTNEAEDYSAYEDMFAMLKNAKFCGGVLHCFSGRKQDAIKALDMGFYIGINGIISYKRNDDLRDTVKYIGPNNLLLETDCPYLPPQTKRGKRNNPANIPEIAAYLATTLGIDIGVLDIITTENTKKLFSI